MNMQDAFLLANQAAKVPGVTVISCGHYVPHHQVTDATPWKICVMSTCFDKPSVVGNEAELRLFVDRMHSAQANAQPAGGMLF